jgi:DNA-binding transcriptional LysR family regulator
MDRSRPSLDDAAIFITLVNSGSLSSAGRQLNMSISTVSKRITRLEHHLKAQLVIRSSRRLTLTQAGTVFFEQCEALLSVIDTAAQKVQDLNREPRGLLRIHATVGVATKLIAPLIVEFQNRHPEIEFDILTYSRNPTFAAEGQDVVIGSFSPHQKSFQTIDLGRCDYVICASPSYLDQAGVPPTPQDIALHKCLVYVDDEANRPFVDWPFMSNGREALIHVHGSVTSNNSAALTELALKGAGIAMLPIFAVFAEIRSQTLVALFRDKIAYSRQLQAFYPRSEHAPRSVTAFLEFVKIHLRNRTLSDL